MMKITDEMIEKYLSEKRTLNVHNSDNTTRRYRNEVHRWIAFLQSEAAATDEGKGANELVLEFIDNLEQTGAPSKQIKATLHILNNFHSYFDQEFPGNPFEALAKQYRIDKKETTLKAIERDNLLMTDDEILKIIKWAWSKTKNSNMFYTAYRNAVMIEMLAEYGLRISALIGINIADVDLDRRCIYINESKNQKPYVIPIINKIIMVNDYLRIYFTKFGYSLGPIAYDSRPLFLSGEDKNRISDSTARRCINRVFARVGLYASQRSTHQLRHYRATKYYREGMSPELISQIMGMSVETLKKTYLHIGHTDIVDQFERWNVTGKQQFECPACGYRAGNKTQEKVSLINVLNRRK